MIKADTAGIGNLARRLQAVAQDAPRVFSGGLVCRAREQDRGKARDHGRLRAAAEARG